VKPADVQGIKWDDLLTARWKGRVAWDAQALGFKELPFHPACPISRLKAFTTNLGANKVKLIDGGTNGVIQAVIQGEGDNFDKVEENRKIAIEGMKAGLQSGQMVPYP
jgi:hypothetical protein